MLSNFDIERICKKIDLPLVGVFSKDKLPKERSVGSYYINMENSDDGDGTHWVLAKIYNDADRDENVRRVQRKKDNIGALYFDPFGVDMPKEVEEFLKPFKPIPYNNRQIQSINTTECGWYCIFCDYTLEHKQYGDSYIEDYERFLGMWSDDTRDNLRLLKSYMKPIK